MKKFIKGAFELDYDITDLVGYEEKHRNVIEEIIDWADNYDVRVNMGTSDDNTYLIEYRVVGRTVSLCKGIVAELKSILKTEWKQTKLSWQVTGDTW
jgi:hypothetical protein